MADFSFRTKLQLAFALVIVVALALPALYARMVFQDDIMEDVKLGAVRELRLAEQLLGEHGSFAGEEDMHHWFERLGAKLDARVTYVTEGGRVVADSHVAYPSVAGLDNHAFRPEIAQAETERFGMSVRYSATLGRKLIYAATRVTNLDGVPPGYIRLAMPFADVRERLDRLYDNVLVVFGLAVVLAMILSVLLTRSFGRSMAEMIGVAEAIGGGHYERRLREYPGREFSGLAKAINRMAVSIAEQVRTITDQKRELEAVLDGMREGVMVLDADGRISQVNTALKRIVGSMRDMEGQRPMDLVLSPELQRACDGVLAPDAGDGPRWLQIEPQKGRVYDVTIVGLDERGANLGAVVVFHDISELKRLERVRRDFVANVSHELRTPLTTIKGYAETLIDNKLAGGGTAESFLGIILRNADRMVKMVEDLLSLSRLEAREESFTPRDVDARGALAEALRICVPLAERVGVSLEPRLPEAGLRVWADFDLLMQVFRNLLENAVRYSPSGEAVIVDGATDAEGFVHFMVSDRGPGIPAEDRDRIFERFYRVEKHRMRSGSGSTGLGLAICRHIVERHGGRIWVEPRTDEKGGSIFHFTLATPPEVLDGDSSQETGNHNA